MLDEFEQVQGTAEAFFLLLDRSSSQQLQKMSADTKICSHTKASLLYAHRTCDMSCTASKKKALDHQVLFASSKCAHLGEFGTEARQITELPVAQAEAPCRGAIQ